MTHDELLKTVETDQELTKYLDKGLVSGDITINTARQHWFQSNALRAVVELHKPYIPMDNETGDYSVLAYCNCSKAFNERDAITYPCPTIQAIEKELA